MKKHKDNKKQHPSEPRWVGPLSLLLGYLIYIILCFALMGEFPSPVGSKGEGLLFILIFYLPVRAIFGVVYMIKSKKAGGVKT